MFVKTIKKKSFHSFSAHMMISVETFFKELIELCTSIQINQFKSKELKLEEGVFISSEVVNEN